KEDRLPCARFAGKRVEARLEPDGRAFDNGQIGDVEFDQHAGSAFQSTTSRNGSCLTHQLCPPEPSRAKHCRMKGPPIADRDDERACASGAWTMDYSASCSLFAVNTS